jgi:dihydropteroate synthase
MGVLNVTPDSFSDGGRYFDPGAAAARVEQLVRQGADIVDIGGESTRPGAEPVSTAEQIERITPAVERAVSLGRTLVSVDTASPEVADRMLSLGADLVNDVSCLADSELARVAARHAVPIVIMHSRGPMKRMPGFSTYPDDAYGDIVDDVLEDWYAARERALEAGVARKDVLLDPGFGFAKNARHSFELLRRLGELARANARIVVGPSRKSFLAAADPAPPDERLGGTIAACVLAALRGASVVRVHDVRPVRQALAVQRSATSAFEARHA